MTREDYLSLIARIESRIEDFKRDHLPVPAMSLLENRKKALRELYIENLQFEMRVCGLRVPGLIMTGTTESRKTAGELTLRAGAIREELKSLGA